MDIVSYFNCILDEFLEENTDDYDDYLDCLTLLGEENGLSKKGKDKAYERFAKNVTNEWKNDFNKELE